VSRSLRFLSLSRRYCTTLVDRVPTGKEWLHEIKFDGYRTALRLDGGSPRMLTRSGVGLDGRVQADRRRGQPSKVEPDQRLHAQGDSLGPRA
jgi:bifunctional non-homologous end joining protein LigD